MKKIFSLICVLSALIFGAVFTGCDADDNDFIAPKDTWLYKSSSKSENSFTYSWGEDENKKTVKFDVYINYATKEGSIKFNNETDETSQKVQPGLNVILVPQAETENEKSSVKALFNLAESANIDQIAVYKSFEKEAQAGNDDSTAKPQTLGTTAWTFIYNLNRFESMGTKSMSNEAKNLTLITEIGNLNWKRVLYNMLGDKLLGE